MRRPQTKTPLSYHHTATRHRGRTVHRIYAATPRPAREAYFIFYQLNVIQAIGMSLTGNEWYTVRIPDRGPWDVFRANPTPWALWNEVYWNRLSIPVGTWFEGMQHIHSFFQDSLPCPFYNELWHYIP